MDHTDIVARAKADLEAKGVNLTGRAAHSASSIWSPTGFPALACCARVVAIAPLPQPDGSCLSGEQTGAPGYATDYPRPEPRRRDIGRLWYNAFTNVQKQLHAAVSGSYRGRRTA
jgi:hypothetical protein